MSRRPSFRDKLDSEDAYLKTERKVVNRYNRIMFSVGLVLAIVIPPLIYRWKRQSMKRLEDGANKDIERMYQQGRKVSDIPRK